MRSINLYQKGLMNDINLTLRLIDKEQTHITKPIEWIDDHIIFEAPLHQLNNVLYPIGTHLNVLFVGKVALFLSSISIIKSYRKENRLYYVGEITSPLTKKQQRQSFRLEVTMDVHYRVLPTEKYLPSSTIMSLPLKVGTCINLSLGGICIVCDEQLHSHTILSLAFTLMDQKIQLKGKVLYIGEETTSGTYIHRIKFIHLSHYDTNLLNRLIFKKQLLQLKHP